MPVGGLFITFTPSPIPGQDLGDPWTPTFTFTPRPTRTPVPTSTPVPTLTAAQLCQFFRIISPQSGQIFDFSATMPLAWDGVPRGRSMLLRINRQGEVAGLQLEAPAGGGIVPVMLGKLPGHGLFEWRAAVVDPLYGEICEQRGMFTRLPPVYF